MRRSLFVRARRLAPAALLVFPLTAAAQQTASSAQAQLTPAAPPAASQAPAPAAAPPPAPQKVPVFKRATQ